LRAERLAREAAKSKEK